jgi:integrase
MAHIQRRCSSCRRTIPTGARTCPGCGSHRSSWVARWLDPDGVTRTQAFRRHAEADRFLAHVEAARATGTYMDPTLGRTPLTEIVQTWYASAAPSLKPKTRASYRGLIDVRILPYLGRRQVASIRPSDVQKWVNELTAEGLSSSRVRQAHIVLGMALDTAVHDGVIARNPARRSGVKLPKLERRQPVALVPEQVASIADASPPPYDLLVRLLGTTGLRWGEAVALRRRSVDLLGRRLVVTESLAEIGAELIFGPTKSHAERSVPLTRPLVVALDRHLDERVDPDLDALVFTSEKGRPLRYSNFRREIWNRALKTAKVPKVGLHVLRHSAAAAMIRAGASPKALQTILGHQSAGFTLSVYGHVFEQDIAELVLRLEEVVDTEATGLRAEDGPPSGRRLGGRS